jgi:hypothetical protein
MRRRKLKILTNHQITCYLVGVATPKIRSLLSEKTRTDVLFEREAMDILAARDIVGKMARFGIASLE